MSDFPKTIWIARPYDGKPSSLTVLGETDKFWVIDSGWNDGKSRRLSKRPHIEFETWEECRNFMVARARRCAASLREDAADEDRLADRLAAMTGPEAA